MAEDREHAREQADRLYAAHLLNRLEGSSFDHRDVAVLARIIPLIEGDVRDLLGRYAAEVADFHSVAHGFIRTASDLIEEGAHRPDVFRAAEAKEPAQ